MENELIYHVPTGFRFGSLCSWTFGFIKSYSSNFFGPPESENGGSTHNQNTLCLTPERNSLLACIWCNSLHIIPKVASIFHKKQSILIDSGFSCTKFVHLKIPGSEMPNNNGREIIIIFQSAGAQSSIVGALAGISFKIVSWSRLHWERLIINRGCAFMVRALNPTAYINHQNAAGFIGKCRYLLRQMAAGSTAPVVIPYRPI